MRVGYIPDHFYMQKIKAFRCSDNTPCWIFPTIDTPAKVISENPNDLLTAIDWRNTLYLVSTNSLTYADYTIEVQ
jgi:hypothetical protein